MEGKRGPSGGFRPSPSGPRGPWGRDDGRPPSYVGSPEYLRAGYLDELGHVRPEVVTGEAERVAGELDRGNLRYAQIRRFFDKVRCVEARLAAGHDFAELKATIASLKPQAADAVNRGVAPPAFRTFMEKNVDLALRNEGHFKGFVEHFQSIVCYYPRRAGE